MYYGGRILLSSPSVFRFTAGLGMSASLWEGRGGHDYMRSSVQEEFPALAAPEVLLLSAEPRLGIRISDTMDAWVLIPVTYSMVKNAPLSEQTVSELEYQERLEVESFSPVGVGVMCGIQFQVPVFVPDFY